MIFDTYFLSTFNFHYNKRVSFPSEKRDDPSNSLLDVMELDRSSTRLILPPISKSTWRRWRPEYTEVVHNLEIRPREIDHLTSDTLSTTTESLEIGSGVVRNFDLFKKCLFLVGLRILRTDQVLQSVVFLETTRMKEDNPRDKNTVTVRSRTRVWTFTEVHTFRVE